VQFVLETTFAADSNTPLGNGPGPGGRTYLRWAVTGGSANGQRACRPAWSSPAQRSVRAVAQEANSYHYFACHTAETGPRATRKQAKIAR